MRAPPPGRREELRSTSTPVQTGATANAMSEPLRALPLHGRWRQRNGRGCIPEADRRRAFRALSLHPRRKRRTDRSRGLHHGYECLGSTHRGWKVGGGNMEASFLKGFSPIQASPAGAVGVQGEAEPPPPFCQPSGEYIRGTPSPRTSRRGLGMSGRTTARDATPAVRIEFALTEGTIVPQGRDKRD